MRKTIAGRIQAAIDLIERSWRNELKASKIPYTTEADKCRDRAGRQDKQGHILLQAALADVEALQAKPLPPAGTTWHAHIARQRDLAPMLRWLPANSKIFLEDADGNFHVAEAEIIEEQGAHAPAFLVIKRARMPK